MHHKRHRPKNRRSGCLRCKPHKANGCKREKLNVLRRTVETPTELAREDRAA